MRHGHMALDQLLENVRKLADLRCTADAALEELCELAPNLLFGVTTFEGRYALTIGGSFARIGKTAFEFEDHPALYARSEVQWNRWAVDASDRALRRIRVAPTPVDKLNRYWGMHDIRDYRRVVVCEGSRALALLGVSVVDDRPPCEGLWLEIEARLQSVAGLVRAGFRLANGAPSDGREHGSVAEACAYLAPDGTLLAAADWAKRARALRHVRERLRARSWEPYGFEVDGRSFRLEPADELREHGGFVLTSSFGRSTAPRAGSRVNEHPPGEGTPAEHEGLLDALARGLTNREVATLLGTTPRAIKKRLERLYERHGASNRRELLYFLSS